MRCQYCGSTTAAPAAAQPAPPQPPPGYYGYGHGHGQGHPPPQPSAHFPPQATRSRSGLGIGLGIAFAVLGTSAASIIPMLTRTSSTTTTNVVQQALGKVTSGGVASKLSNIGWSTSEPGCFIDANGDGVMDVAGLSGPSEMNTPTVVDGKTGEILFKAEELSKAVQLGCLGADAGFFVTEGNFKVNFYTSRKPWGRTQVMARDKVDSYGTGQGCVQLKTDDGTTQGVQLPSGVATTCPVLQMRRYYGFDEPGVVGLTDKSTDLVVGPRKYSLTKRASGTEILTVKVSEGSRVIWSKEQPYAACTFGAGIAAGAGKIMLWAAQPADRNKGFIIGLDEATGNQLYELPITDSVSHGPRSFKFNGKYVLAVSWGALRAYDPATGAEAWRVGR